VSVFEFVFEGDQRRRTDGAGVLDTRAAQRKAAHEHEHPLELGLELELGLGLGLGLPQRPNAGLG
jgi:hypothetical protein